MRIFYLEYLICRDFLNNMVVLRSRRRHCVAIHPWIRRWLHKPSLDAQNLKYRKSVDVTNGKHARLRCFLWMLIFYTGVIPSLQKSGWQWHANAIGQQHTPLPVLLWSCTCGGSFWLSLCTVYLVGLDVTYHISDLRITGVWECDVNIMRMTGPSLSEK